MSKPKAGGSRENHRERKALTRQVLYVKTKGGWRLLYGLGALTHRESRPGGGAALDDPRFKRGLSPNEQSVLRDLNSLRYPGNP